MRSSGQRQSGFTLLEVLVSLAVLALVYGTILHLLGGSTRVATRASAYREALMLAESQLSLAATIRDADQLPRSGDVDQRFHWELSFLPFEGPDAPAVQSFYTPVIATVRVSWGQTERRTHVVELSTVRLDAGGTR